MLPKDCVFSSLSRYMIEPRTTSVIPKLHEVEPSSTIKFFLSSIFHCTKGRFITFGSPEICEKYVHKSNTNSFFALSRLNNSTESSECPSPDEFSSHERQRLLAERGRAFTSPNITEHLLRSRTTSERSEEKDQVKPKAF